MPSKKARKRARTEELQQQPPSRVGSGLAPVDEQFEAATVELEKRVDELQTKLNSAIRENEEVVQATASIIPLPTTPPPDEPAANEEQNQPTDNSAAVANPQADERMTRFTRNNAESEADESHPNDGPAKQAIAKYKEKNKEKGPTVVKMTKVLDLWKREGRKLSHLAEPERTKLWLDMYFEPYEDMLLDATSLWDVYVAVFGPFTDTSPHLDTDEFLAVLHKTFKGLKEALIRDDVAALCGIARRRDVKPYEQIMQERKRRERRRTERRLRVMETTGEITLRTRPLNAFQEHLRRGPLLSLPHGQPSPFVLRLRSRAEGNPLGDTVPGFETVSMKKIQKMYKHAEDYLRHAAAGPAVPSPAPSQPAVQAPKQAASTKQPVD